MRQIGFAGSVINAELRDEFRSFASLDGADEDSIVFCEKTDDAAVERVLQSRARIVLVNQEIEKAFTRAEPFKKTIYLCHNPKLIFVKLLRAAPKPAPTPSDIDSGGRNISKLAVIGAGSAIGNNCFIGNVVIGQNCTIGFGVQIFDGTEIGDDVTIGPYCVIGSPGFGYVKDDDGKFLHFPHIGQVRIGNRVEIFSHCDINRGTLGATVIGDDAKINYHVHIAHNCQIGEGCLIRSGVHVCGSACVERNVKIGASAVIRGHIRLGEGSVIGFGSVVTKDVKAGSVVMGNPARPRQDSVSSEFSPDEYE